jgi:hypothetical protein
MDLLRFQSQIPGMGKQFLIRAVRTAAHQCRVIATGWAG